MASKILILGGSGVGKTTSLRNLDPKSTYINQVVRKDLPFRGWKAKFNKENKNISVISSPSKIISLLKGLSENAPHVKNVIIDDFQYCMGIEFMTTTITGYDKFTSIAKNAFSLLQAPDALREDLTIIFLSHIENSEGLQKMKTIGKMLDEKIVPEGLFSIVLKAEFSDGNYHFKTQNSGSDTIKSPMGMLDEKEPNDLRIILDKITEYNKG